MPVGSKVLVLSGRPRRRPQAAAIMAMKASRLTNKSKISKPDDVENSVRYFSIVIIRAIFKVNGLRRHVALYHYLSGIPVICVGFKQDVSVQANHETSGIILPGGRSVYTI